MEILKITAGKLWFLCYVLTILITVVLTLQVIQKNKNSKISIVYQLNLDNIGYFIDCDLIYAWFFIFYIQLLMHFQTDPYLQHI